MSLLNKIIHQYKELWPSFYRKDEDSNIHKHISVIAKQKRDFIEQKHIVEMGLQIDRPITIQKIQERFFECKLIFRVNIRNLQQIIITNEETLPEPVVVDEKIFEEEGNNYYEFVLNVESETQAVPSHKYKITVTTFDDFTYTKGYPENDTRKDDDYDHDYNLDRIGSLYNIPRYNHIPVQITDYEKTLPPYHIKASEDDYYYMNRIMTYIKEYNHVPLPILELWKYYGVYSKMENRKIMIHQQNVHDMQPTPTPFDSGLPIYMKTKYWYNSCAYDIYVNYSDFPTNLTLPQESDVIDIFTNNLPVTKVSQYNVNVTITNSQDIELYDGFKVKLGDTVIIDSDPYAERDYWTIKATDLKLYMEEDENYEIGDLVLTNTEEDTDYIVAMDSKMNLWIIDSDIEDDAELYLDTELGELQVIKEEE